MATSSSKHVGVVADVAKGEVLPSEGEPKVLQQTPVLEGGGKGEANIMFVFYASSWCNRQNSWGFVRCLGLYTVRRKEGKRVWRCLVKSFILQIRFVNALSVAMHELSCLSPIGCNESLHHWLLVWPTLDDCVLARLLLAFLHNRDQNQTWEQERGGMISYNH